MHRLGHDPRSNLEATSFNGKVVWHTDLDPNQEYDFNYSAFDSRTEFQLPSLKALTVGLEFRELLGEAGHLVFRGIDPAARSAGAAAPAGCRSCVAQHVAHHLAFRLATAEQATEERPSG